ncbi:MAG: type II toxin-antitoxin system prevent-host-death family antitoxin [Anaerolineae bacterium]|nr:type II toxin-antitoxin system prevent-host-death family antitoxin [Anaerolineae bacterium]
MKVLEKEQASDSLSHYVEQVGEDTLIIVVNGKPVAALMSLEGVDDETIAVSTNPKFRAIIERSRRRDRLEGRLSSEEVRKLFADTDTGHNGEKGNL